MDLSKIKYTKKRWSYKQSLFFSHFERPILNIAKVIDAFAAIASICCIIGLTIYAGYNLSANDKHTVWIILRFSQFTFALSVIYGLVLRTRYTLRNSKIIKWIVDIAILVSLLPWAYPHPVHPWVPWLSKILYSHTFLFAVLGSYSIVNICYLFSRIPNRRTNPALLMGMSFLFFILIGSFALMLPRCTYHGISYFDSLFVSSSAVCITGLTSVDIPTTFTPLGVIVISVLVQLGSLGVITFTSFFALFFAGNTSIYNQLLLRDMIYSKSMNSLIPTLLYVLGFTITIELIGTVVVFFTVPDSLAMTFEEKLIFSAFHSMSSFCNAGFSCLPNGMANAALMQSNQAIYIATSLLIIAGAIGFPILVNLREIIAFHLRKLWDRIRGVPHRMMRLHIFDLNTKLVLCTTTIIFLIGTASFFFLEYDNTLKGMTTYQKIVQSAFNALIPRSAGFSSVNPVNFLDVTLLLIVVQMIIGGSSQSMAGGIKVNTFGTVMLNLKAVLLGHKGTSAFNRTLNPLSIRRANAVLAISSLALLAYCITLLLLEPALPAKSVIFEAVSGLFTVGSSLGITSELSDASKAVLCSAMFFGRVGLLSILGGLMRKNRDRSESLPIESVIIN